MRPLAAYDIFEKVISYDVAAVEIAAPGVYGAGVGGFGADILQLVILHRVVCSLKIYGKMRGVEHIVVGNFRARAVGRDGVGIGAIGPSPARKITVENRIFRGLRQRSALDGHAACAQSVEKAVENFVFVSLRRHRRAVLNFLEKAVFDGAALRRHAHRRAVVDAGKLKAAYRDVVSLYLKKIALIAVYEKGGIFGGFAVLEGEIEVAVGVDCIVCRGIYFGNEIIEENALSHVYSVVGLFGFVLDNPGGKVDVRPRRVVGPVVAGVAAEPVGGAAHYFGAEGLCGGKSALFVLHLKGIVPRFFGNFQKSVFGIGRHRKLAGGVYIKCKGRTV